ncbi:solute carrier family 49 member 4-like isoform X2 [Portunus trituberculatus]|uniref:solute carrier family 49 member 4-like isoform X2 n=1 Tax=Portunus trituberculatus TaxID=210409 RepID=UPI001E1D0690|nr:solute carrier family 49 member 4-like isoform X2 [Portunus trituberculatus]
MALCSRDNRSPTFDVCDASPTVLHHREGGVVSPSIIYHEEDLKDDKEALLGSYHASKSYGSINEGSGDPPEEARTYRSRFWILIVFTLMNLVLSVEWAMFGPISESMQAAFPGWDATIVTLTINGGIIAYIVAFIPVCWAVQHFGLRACLLSTFGLATAGTALRCITSTTPAFTILCQVCGVAVGLAAPMMLAGPAMIANEWFPVQERTTAMGAGLAAILLVAALVYFPSKPPSPPSVTSCQERFTILPALKVLIKNKKFILILVSYGIFAGPPLVWLTVIDYSLLPLGFHQEKAMWVGVSALMVSSLLPVVVGRLNDLLRGHTKTLLLVLMMTTTVFFFWFLLLSYGVLPVTDWQVYVTAVGSLSFSLSTLPLFMEMAIDLVYPSPELLVTAVMIAADNVTGMVFLFLFHIPDSLHLWTTYTLTLCSSITIVPLVAVSFPTTRMTIDTD